MPLPDHFDIVTYQGDTLSLVFTLVTEEGDAIDLTNAVFKMQIRQRPGATVLREIVYPEIFVYQNTVSITADIELEEGNYLYDLEATYPSSVRTYAAGQFNVVSDITRT